MYNVHVFVCRGETTQFFSLFKSITGSYGKVWVEVLVRGYFNIDHEEDGAEGFVLLLNLC